jgi:acyl-CoA thioesterase
VSSHLVGEVSSHFDRETALTPLGEGRFAGRVSKDFWVQAGPNGGFLAAVAMRGAMAMVPEPERIARSMHVRFLSAPKDGDVELLVDVTRRGKSMTSLAMRMQQGGKDFLHASAAFSTAFSPIAFQDCTMPEARPLAECPPVPKQIELNHRFDMLHAIGPAMRSGERAISGGYLRFADPRPIDTLALSALWDVWPPAVFARAFDQRFRGAVPTVEASVYFRRPVPLPNASLSDYVLARFETTMGHDGFAEESGEIWSQDGLLLAHSRQLCLLL